MNVWVNPAGQGWGELNNRIFHASLRLDSPGRSGKSARLELAICRKSRTIIVKLVDTPQQPFAKLPQTHYVSDLLYTDQQVFDDEMKLIMGRVWRLVCHESELANKYDYRTFDHVGVPLLMVRGDDNKIRSFVNVCSHRGAKLVNEVSGNARFLTCFYHHWRYDSAGRCVSIPRPRAYEGTSVTPNECGLREIRTENKYGLIFINLDDNCVPLDDFLAGSLEFMKPALTEVELEVFHFHRTVVPGNWKDWQATNMDPYHEFMHSRLRQTNVMSDEGMDGRLITLFPNGHSNFAGMVAKYDKSKATQSRDVSKCLPGVHPSAFQSVPLFPNGLVATRGTVMRIDITWPLSPLSTLVEWRGLGVKGDTPEERMMRVNHHNEFWGPCSPNQPEDGYAVEALGRAFGAGGGRPQIIAREENLRGQDDGCMRSFFSGWSQYMGRPASDPRQAA